VVAWLALLAGLVHWENVGWLAAAVVGLALATSLVSMSRSLPAQNVAGAAAIIALGGSVVEMINANSGIPFGFRTYTEDGGPNVLGVLAWFMPFLWVVVILNSRGVARLILRPWRKLPKYGLLVIGLTSVLAAIFDVGLEPFASARNRYWIWRPPPGIPQWHTAPFFTFLGWMVVTVLILAFATPWLINKHPGRKSPPDYHPLVMWCVLNLTFAVGCAVEHVWSASVVTVCFAGLVGTFALRGARW
jgi:uncharacterized membrane protein